MKKLIYLLPVLMIAVFSCRNKEMKMADMPAETPAVEQTDTVSMLVEDYIPAENQYNTVTRCLVTNEKVTVNKDTKAVKYKDKIYYFCCPACIASFKADPEKYAE